MMHTTPVKRYRNVEAHLAYEVSGPSPTDVTFAWKEQGVGDIKAATHTYPPRAGQEDSSWTLPVGPKVETMWVDYAVK